MEDTSGEVHIRTYQPSDEASLREMICSLQDYERDTLHIKTHRTGAEVVDDEFEELMKLSSADPTHPPQGEEQQTPVVGKIFLASLRDRVIGFATVTSGEPLDGNLSRSEFKSAEVDSLFVRPEFRSKGVARRLMDACENFAKEQRVTHLKVDVLAANKSAIRFYEMQNFEGYLLTLVKPISSNATSSD